MEDAFLIKDLNVDSAVLSPQLINLTSLSFSKTSLIFLLVNLRMEALYVKESMNIRWVAETGIIDSIEAIIKVYKETRGLLVGAESVTAAVILFT